jgi:hypothetical protein
LDSEALIYLYGIVPSDAPEAPEELVGMEGGPVQLVRIGQLGAIVSLVPAEQYSDEALNARLDDLAWVGERGITHEQVLDWYAGRVPLIPLSLFSLHRDAERLRTRVIDDEDGFVRLLERLTGRREWGIKLWRRSAMALEKIDQLSPSLRELGQQIDEAPTGKRFLLEKKRQSMRNEEIRIVSVRLAHELLAELRRAAADAVAIPIPATQTPTERVLLLDAAFLVDEAAFGEFQEAVTAQAGKIADSGFELEFTGPWPPYHFAGSDDE